ncbi:PIG-L deacetylase family protein [Thermoflavimicrobium dichotomicum]|uniref:N-acetylglucosaminyl deacetylase, LmbE family n=1 Tax=Thermoflavimicrobium dichotomicum TaxID=46223 RepID=A0A1I3UAH4_9BACL|nr:PIG-L family deacetylase [Thermoflavimicrobium dichotomicum]SFJ80504.1 N-acetylglucosaminyl deacetylase, LmbE family [Thermoflavimicrobium dichotomicum]
MKRLLFVYAHPDDESFTVGGTIAKYAEQGDVEIHLICATRGEAGKTGNPPQCSPEELPKVREQELKSAVAHLGLHHLHFLNYKDGTLSDVPVETLSQDIMAYLKQIAPQVVVTFAPHGISGHKDHIAISQATYKAVTESNVFSVKKLYYVTIPASMGEKMGRKVYTDPDSSITTIIECEKYKPQVMKALLEHKTQNMSVDKAFPGVLAGDDSNVPGKNYFILAWQRIIRPINKQEHDLFDGISSQV